MSLVFSISNFFITKTSQANKWMRKEIPSCSNSVTNKQKFPFVTAEPKKLGLFL